jgi:hypothetical protein
MPRDLPDPYVADVAEALRAAGLAVTETWTEPVTPVDHCIAIAVEPRGTVHLVWDTAVGWRFFVYAPGRVAAGVEEAGPLPRCFGRTDVTVVVVAARELLGRLDRTGA